MRNNFPHKQTLHTAWLLLACCYFFSCSPEIHSFTVTPLTIVKDDSVKIKWSVKGEPTLLVHTDSAEDEQPETRVFTLVAQKNGKEKKSVAEVTVLPRESADDIIFSVTRKGSAIVATMEKNIEKWGTHFTLKTISAAPGRTMTVTHGGKTVQLPADGSASSQMDGLPNGGNWEIESPLSPAEISDSSRIPSKLRLHTIIVYKKS